MRDPTRGGLAASLAELAEDGGVELTVVESHIPVSAGVRAACELLGLDPLVVANEGKLVALVSADAAEAALSAFKRHRLGAQAALIGYVSGRGQGRVVLQTRAGGRRLVELPYGEELPRIC